MKIAVYGFSGSALCFARMISLAGRRELPIEWSAILPQGHYLPALRAVLPEASLLYLYGEFNQEYARLTPPYALPAGEGVESAFQALLKDKDGYRHLDKDEQLRRAAAIYAVYKRFLSRVRPDYLLFPDLEVVDGFLLLSVCRELGIQPIYHVGMRMLDLSFFSGDSYESLPPYFGPADALDRQRATQLLDAFERDASLPTWTQRQAPAEPLILPGRWRRLARALAFAAGPERLHASEDNWVLKLKRNLLPLLNRWRRARFRLQRRYFDIRGTDEPLPADFILYALQYTPESSINGLEPYYVDQFRAIDALLLAMPGHFRLLVKEHPAIAGVRADAFYRQLRRKPGVELVAPEVDTRRLMQQARLVVSITGTIGLEAYLSGKPCLLMGRNFFGHLCAKGQPGPDFGQALRDVLTDFQPASREARIDALARLLHVGYPFELADPLAVPSALSEANLANLLDALLSHIQRLEGLGATPSRSTRQVSA